MVDFAVTKEKNLWLKEKMISIGLLEGDLEEKFIYSSGKGGQKVNKTNSCVYIRHIPTGVEVKCKKERSQSVNRFLARRILIEKIESITQGRDSKSETERKKIRKQKQKRRKRRVNNKNDT